MGYGMGGHLAISRQDSFGTATASWEYIPFASESLVTNIEELIEEGMYARYDESPSHEGLLTVAGDITFEPHPIMIGHFLRSVTGQASNTAVGSAQTWEFLPRQVDFDDKTALPPYTLQVYRDNGSAWQITDAIVNAMSFEVGGGKLKKATASLICRVSSLMTKTTPSYITAAPWRWDACSVSMAGAAFGDMESLTISIDNKVEGVSLLDATRMHSKYKRTGPRGYAFNGTMDFASQAQYNNFRANSSQAIVVSFRGDTVATSYNNLLVFDMPQVRYKSYPVAMGGAGRISVGFEGNPKYNTTSSYAMRITLTNTRVSY